MLFKSIRYWFYARHPVLRSQNSVLETDALERIADWAADINLLATTRAALFIAKQCYAFWEEPS